MKKYISLFSLFLFLVLFGISLSNPQLNESRKISLPELNIKLKNKLLTFLKENYMTPEEYVISKLKDYDVVFIGEYHRIKHDVELIHRLIPILYKAGIYNLGIEFGVYHDQNKVDNLITAKAYDSQIARELMFNFIPIWGYKEYMDIYKAAWEVNHNLKPNAPRFRVVNLNARQDWSHVKTQKDRKNTKIMKKVWFEGNSDEFMAETILNEFIAKKKKALIYMGTHHAFTRYHQPVVRDGKVVRFVNNRTGNLIYNKIGNKAFRIDLHKPFPKKDSKGEVYAVNGIIDALLYKSNLKPVGFDIVATPFGKLPSENSFYSLGYESFTLEDFCDGYIYTKPISEYEGVSVDKQFITEENYEKAVSQIPNPGFKNSVKGIEDFLDALESSANIPGRFKIFY